MTPQQAINELKELAEESEHEDDPEVAHLQADEVLCELLMSLEHVDVVTQWRKVKKWYA